MGSVQEKLVPRPGEATWRFRLRLSVLNVAHAAADLWHRAAGRTLVDRIPGADQANIRRILVLAPNKGLGDVVLYRPALSALRSRYPNASLDLVAPSVASALLSGSGIGDRIIPSRIFGPKTAMIAQAMTLRRQRYDLVIDFIRAFSLPSAIVAALTGARWLVGIDYGKRGPLFNVRVTPGAEDRFSDMCQRLCEAAGAPKSGAEVPLPSEPPPADIGAWFAADSAPVVVLHAGARDNLDLCDKRWPAAHYADLAARLTGAGLRVVAVGSAEERGDAEPIVRRMEGNARFFNAVGRTTVKQLVGLIGRCAALVGNNSGPVHVAAALAVPSISFSGGVDLRRWAPRGRGTNEILLRDERCRADFCWQCPDKGLRCLAPISPERTAEAVLRIIKEKK